MMLTHLTMVDLTLWVLELGLLALVCYITYVPSQRTLLTYLLVAQVVRASALLGTPAAYAQVFYVLQVPEDLLLALAALGTSIHVVPRFKPLLTWAGPVVLALPGFLLYLLRAEVTHLAPAELLATVAVGGGLVLLALCLLDDPGSPAGLGYAGFLACLLLGARAHLLLGYTFWGRTLPEAGWVAGLLWWAGVLGRHVTDRERTVQYQGGGPEQA